MTDVRPYEPADYAAVRTCMLELQEFERALEPRRRKSGEAVADDYLAYLEGECRAREGLILLATEGGKVVGFICAWVQRDQDICSSGFDAYGFVSDVVVLPGHGKQGIGRLLLTSVDKAMQSKEIYMIKLFALARNAVARETYRKAGYREYEVMFLKELSK
jgi:ribosomal protein S18 acetylase RimI-like enzyme